MTFAKHIFFLMLALTSTLVAVPVSPSLEKLYSRSTHVLEVEITLLAEKVQKLDPFVSDRSKSGTTRRYRLEVKRVWKEMSTTPESFEMTLFRPSNFQAGFKVPNPMSLPTGLQILTMIRNEGGGWSFTDGTRSLHHADAKTRTRLDQIKASPPPHDDQSSRMPQRVERD